MRSFAEIGYPSIHSTLWSQTPGRKELYPSKQQELDPEFAEAPVSYLAVDFDELLQTKEALTRRAGLIKDWQIHAMMHGLEQRGIFNEAYNHIIDRIQEETGFFHEAEEAGALHSIVSLFVNGTVGDTPIKWGKDEYIEKIGCGGYYHTKRRDITINADPPKTRHELLELLGVFGEFPSSTLSAMHERVHAIQLSHQQNNTAKRSKQIKENPFAYTDEFGEAQAMRNGNRSIDTISRRGLFNVIRNAETKDKKSMYDVEEDKLRFAIVAVDQLSALGFSVEEISKLVMFPGKWDSALCMYPKIIFAIFRRAQDLGLRAYDVENLVLADKIERDIEKFRVMQIVQEELVAFYGQPPTREEVFGKTPEEFRRKNQERVAQLQQSRA